MQKWIIILSILCVILLGGWFLVKNFSIIKIENKSLIKTNGKNINLNMPKPNQTLLNKETFKKKILMIIAWRGFRDEEYFNPKAVFEKNNFQVVTASNKAGIAIGAKGGKAKVDISLDKIDLDNYGAIVFSGGPRALDYLDNKEVYKIIQDTVNRKKILGAICISPVILAKSGVLQGKKATVWSSASYHQSIDELVKNGAKYVDQPVVKDGLIITANGPDVAKKFGQEIINSF